MDQLSGAGVLRALEDGRRVARFLLDDPDAAVRRRFRIQHVEEFTVAAAERRRWYAAQSRFGAASPRESRSIGPTA